MQIILLAAWSSSRMTPLSDKTLLKICWKSIIEHQIDTIISAWFDDFLIICNKENILNFKEISKKKKNVRFQFTIQKKLEDWMKWAIESCGNKTKNSVFIVSSNDIVEKYIFSTMFKESQKLKIFWLVCWKIVENYFPGGYISKDKSNNLIDIIEKPWEWKEPSNQINLVLHVWSDFNSFKKKLFTFNNSTDDAYEKTIQAFCKEDEKNIKVIEYKGFWQAVKYPWHINILTNYFLNNQKTSISKNAQVSLKSTIKGKWVIIDSWVKVLENTVINGPVYIWKDSIVWNNVLIRNSSIWDNCIIWFSSEVCRSCMQNNIWTHSNYIWDSVIDSNVSFWAWTITWNLRLDEKEIIIKIKWEKVKTQTNKVWSFIWKDCRLWINISINPWVKIGENSLIWWWIIIWEDIWKNSFVYWDSSIIKKNNLIKIKNRK